MTPEEFVKAVKIAVVRSSVDGTVSELAKPAGRRPAPELVELSEWYKRLPPEDQKQLAAVVARACRLATYGFLCVLDGLKAIEDAPDKGTLELFHVSGEERTHLNDPAQTFLSALFKDE